MGNSTLISVKEIESLLDSAKKREQERANERLTRAIDENREKELPPFYELTSVDFCKNTRITRIQFLQTTYYRTIDRYKTVNGVRYPIYSYWKSKTKTIKKSLKLTNDELERLNSHTDDLIKKFATEIVFEIKDEELFPSWFLKDFLKREYAQKVEEIQLQHKVFRHDMDLEIMERKHKIKANNIYLSYQKRVLSKRIKKQERLSKKLSQIHKSKDLVIWKILTLGIYAYLISDKRQKRLQQKLNDVTLDIDKISKDIQAHLDANGRFQAQIIDLNREIEKDKEETDQRIQNEKSILDTKLSSIVPLKNAISEDESFIPLATIVGLEHEKITGCYIIHNIEKDKYYVGQSKDVMRRLKQHFKGTIPNNIIFAEDYFSSEMADKSGLFEVKIIKCATKDELDRTEKRLIEEYDSRFSGYNGTIGNN